MSRRAPHDEIPDDLVAAFPNVGAPPDEGEPSDAGDGSPRGLDALSGLLEAEEARKFNLADLPTSARWSIAGVLMVVLAVVVLATTRRADLGVYPPGRMVLDLLLLLVPLAATIGFGLRPLSKPALSDGRRALLIGGGAIAVALVVSLPVAHLSHPASTAGIGDDLVHRARTCFSFGVSFAVLAALGMRALDRGRGHRWLPGSLAIWAAGLMGLVSLYLHCPITHPLHLWLGHGTVVLPVFLVAWMMRRRLDG